ncbi:MAG: very short patch repair endonuclease [Beijerinckiaceae bacterium]|nr:very short patch repair endonuclease [Brevundimonas sp.]MCZ8302047.1 very short patch repair endonuclease [Beijerinckiaceae bacterium]
MADTVSPEVRSRMMAGIRGKDTRPELIIRRGLHAAGYRFRLHAKDLPGHPDIVLPKYRAVILVSGCFWHGHDCHLFRIPGTRREFWEAKISRNVERDAEVRGALAALGWRHLSVMECALKGRTKLAPGEVITACGAWIRGGASEGVVEGKRD